ncbi:DUF4249 family protein [Terrimonas rubra]|uniref:DUF4249 family protein n=1 Tax=Terrimonas rubra TaxID=1035890 RepID=A0ABW6A5W8_9BACT
MSLYNATTIIRKPWIYLLAMVSIASFTSCEKVIDLNLNTAEKKYVIEANLTNKAGGCVVLLSQTKDFDEDNTFPGISGATITITTNGTTVTPLTETSTPGQYTAPALIGATGNNYELKVTVAGQTFTANSTMAQPVLIDTIFAKDETLFGETRKIVTVVHPDPVGLGNNYRYIQYFNGNKISGNLIRNDDYSDGRITESSLFYFSDDGDEDAPELKSGDHVRVEMLSITPDIYKYWFSLDRSATGGSGQATPANPVTNIKGGALGYFSVHGIDTKTMIVP